MHGFYFNQKCFRGILRNFKRFLKNFLESWNIFKNFKRFWLLQNVKEFQEVCRNFKTLKECKRLSLLFSIHQKKLFFSEKEVGIWSHNFWNMALMWKSLFRSHCIWQKSMEDNHLQQPFSKWGFHYATVSETSTESNSYRFSSRW